MVTVNGGIMAKRQQAQVAAQANAPKESVAAMMNTLLSREGFQKRFDELLGKRAPQFISSVVGLMNADTALKQAFHDAPVTIIQSALQAASFDLPVNPALGYAYIVPFRNGKHNGAMEAHFIIGWKGMNQLALRSGCYRKINVLDIRAGELKSYDRLREEIELEFVDNVEEREKLPVIGYVGYFQLINGMEKLIYRTVEQLKAHEQKYRQGQYMGKGWRDDPDAMMRKTVFRELIGKWGIMSVTYQDSADPTVMRAAQALAEGHLDDEDRILDKADVVDTHAEMTEEPAEPAPQATIDPDTPFTPEELGDK